MGGLILISISLFYYFTNTSNVFHTALIDKKAYLSSIQEPKVVLVGGSNLAFGVDSRLLSQKLGKPVVNMGLQAELGLPFQWNIIKEDIKKGDIVIFCLEHCYYYDTHVITSGDGIYWWYIIKENPDFFRYIEGEMLQRELVEHFNLFLYLQYYTQISSLFKTPQPITNAYQRNAINQYGDNESVMIDTVPFFTPLKNYHPFPFTEKIAPSFFATLNSFNRHCQSKGAGCLLSFPIYEQGAYQLSYNWITSLYPLIQKELQFPVISSPDRYSYPNQLYFDTVYHLNKKGKKIHTQRFADDIKEVLNK